MKTLRTAVVGLGRIGWQFHIPNIQRHEGFELIAVVDPLEERRREAETTFSTRSYESLERLLESETPDLVVIASPTHFHADQTILSMEKGCDVFCDKPMATDLNEARRMAEAGKRLKKKLMLYQPHRVTKQAVSLVSLLAENLIGPVFMVKKSMAFYTRRNDWQAFRENGGGMVANYGAHAIDQVMHFMEFPPLDSIYCELRRIATLGDADDVVKLVLRTKNGMLIDIDINMASAHPMPGLHIFGQYGGILEEGKNSWKVRWFDPSQLQDLKLQGGLAAKGRKYLNEETIPWQEKTVDFSEVEPDDFYQKVYEHMALDQTPFVPIEQSLEVMRIIEECKKTGEPLMEKYG